MSDTPAPAPVTTRLPRWAKFALIASIALNVLVFGAVAGAFMRGGPDGPAARGSNILGYIATMPQEKRQKLFATTRDLRSQIRPLRQAAREAARERVAALVAEPFDKQRYLAAQTKQIEAESRLRLMLRDLVAEAAATMSQDERRAFARWRTPRHMPMSEDDGLDPPAKGKAP